MSKFFVALDFLVNLGGPFLVNAIFFGLLGWSIWYGNQRRKAGERLAATAGSTRE